MLTKNKKKQIEGVDFNKSYSIPEAVKLIKGEKVSIEDSGLSKREWNELMGAFQLNEKLVK